MNRLRHWYHRPARTPRWLRAGLALVLGTAALFGIFEPSASHAGVSVGPQAALGGRPTTQANAPTKAAEPPGHGNPVTRFPTSPALVSEGRTLYDNGCASCHGLNLQGVHDVAPALYDIGAGPVDFYVSTGRMPLANSHNEPEQARPAYTGRRLDALIAYVVHTGGGPSAPAVDVARGDLSDGFQQFTLHCAGCHQLVGRGGIVIGAYVPSLQDVGPLQVAEAVRMGPYLMPHFDSGQIDQRQLNSLVRYVEWTRHPADEGGWGIFNIGPIPEGLVAWFIGLLAMVIVARLIGERRGADIS